MPRTRRNKSTADLEAEKYSYPDASSANAPTVENEHHLPEDQRAGQPVPGEEYADDYGPSSKPHLHWKGRNYNPPPQEHRALYTHDKISPKSIIAALAKQMEVTEPTLFGDDFNNLPEGHELEPYRHEGNWHNRLIRADSRAAMRSLLYRENMRGKVNLIYFDPPYNKSFRGNFAPAADDLETDEKLEDIPNDPMVIQAYRDNYVGGIDSYLEGIKENLKLARELLAESGNVIMQIGPDNLHAVAMVISEVMGAENHVATIPYVTSTNQSTKMLAEITNWLIWFSRNKERATYHQIYEKMTLKEKVDMMTGWSMIMNPETGSRRPTTKEKQNPEQIGQNEKWYRRGALTSSHTNDKGRSEQWEYNPEEYPQRPRHYPEHAIAYPCPTGRQWSVSPQGLHSIATSGRMHFDDKAIGFIEYADEMPGRRLSAMWANVTRVHDKQYIVETPGEVLDRCILMTTNPGDLVLDLTCGSGAMPVTAEKWGRRWIACDVSAVSIAIARDRILSTTYPYHLLKDSPEGHRTDQELEQNLKPADQRQQYYANPETKYRHNPIVGFVHERQIRISAGTLAKGPDLSDPDDVIRHPDRTIKDDRKVRVASDFEVCSDSPYRAVPPSHILNQEDQNTQEDATELLQEHSFEIPEDKDQAATRVAGNLPVSGISQNGKRRFKVENLQPSSHSDITHTGTLVEQNTGERHKAVFYIGRSSEIISSTRTMRAVRAANDEQAPKAVMIGFAKDADASQTSKRYGNVETIFVQAHRDFQLEHLKEEKRDSAFVIVSEPEITLARTGNPDEVTLEVTGITAYDPKHGITEPPSTRQVMAIMTDTAYDEKRFLPSRYNIIPVKRNRRTLKNLYAAFKKTLEEQSWKRMQTCTTLPFKLPPTEAEADAIEAKGEPRPATKIAVKVVDQIGTEHMLVIHDPRDGEWY